MTKHPIPDAVLDDRLGFVGTTGSGKTYSAKGCVERLLSLKHRVVIIDPLDVWFGLRLSVDGTAPAFPIAILGGRHGDLPINEHSGSIIGEAVAKSEESCIVSLSGLKTGASRERFMLAFLDTLYERTDPDIRDPYHVVFDEADLWAPQKPMGSGAMLCHLMEEIVRRGRVKGFIPWVLTQRPAVINKNVLSQVDGLVAMRLTSSQDRKAIGEWVKGQADEGQWQAIYDALPGMDRGQGVVWLPGHNILKTTSFPENGTFDSSRTPKRGERKQSTSLTPLDLPALKNRLATVEADQKENDTKELKAEIARLKAQKGGVDPAEIASAEQRAYARGREAGYREGIDRIKGKVGDLREFIEAWLGEFGAVSGESWIGEPAAVPLMPTTAASPPAIRILTGDTTPRQGAAGKLLAVMDTNPPVWRTWGQFAALAGLKASGGHYNTGRKYLIDTGQVTEENGLVRIAEPSSSAQAPSLDPAANVKMWAGVLKASAPAILEYLYSVGGSASKPHVAAGLGFVPSGGHWNTGWKQLRDNGIVTLSGDVATLTELFHPKTMRAA